MSWSQSKRNIYGGDVQFVDVDLFGSSLVEYHLEH